MQTPWLRNADETYYPPLQEDIEVDVCVIGGGITGMTTAYLLQEQGRSVAVLERQKLAQGVSGHTSGHLTSLIDAYYHNLISKYSEEEARQIYAATVEAREVVERLISENALDADYERIPAYYYATDDKQLNLLRKEREALQKLGVELKDVELSELPFYVKDAFKVEDQGVINAARYVRGLATAFVNQGGQIFEQTAALDFNSDDQHVAVEAEDGYTIKARDLVQATHVPLKVSPLQMELRNYNSYVIAGESSMQVRKGLFYDFAEPYNYTRHYSEDGTDMFIIGGFDSKTGSHGDQRERLDELGVYASENFRIEHIHYAWSSMFLAPSDDLPFIGEDPVNKRSYVATGFSGDGLTFGLVSAILNTSLITFEEPHPWKRIFNPSRFKLSSVKDVAVKGVETLRHLVFDRLEQDGSRVEEVSLGKAKILNVDGDKVGVYIDEDHGIHVVDPVCNHMKCMVHWNNVAKTWDCGCHGSRYDMDGNVISGPAIHSLKKNIKVEKLR